MGSRPIRFVHPGTFMSPEMTRALASEVAKDPLRKKALDKLMSAVPLGYKPRALKEVNIDWGGKGIGHDECTKDGEAAVSAALIFWATNDVRYGELALAVLKAWATTNKTFSGNNAPLEAAWSVCSMARAAELMKYASEMALAKKWKELEPTFFAWLDSLILPVLRDPSVWRWGMKNNWHFSIVCARMQIAILREDVREWEWSIKTYREIFPKALVQSECCGETVECKRDVTHNQMLLGGMIQAPEVAFHQGVRDLYDDRLVDCVELQARIMMQEVPKGLKREDIKTPYGFWPEPIYEIAYAHFHGRMKKQMPYTQKYLQHPKVRPDRVTFHWGGNTLTHARVTHEASN